MQHNNNPVTVDDDNFAGDMNILLGTVPLSYPWTMWETPNNGNCPVGMNGSGNNCDDQVTFASQIPNNTIVSNGITYKLVVKGFTNNGTNTTCAAAASGSIVNNFLTVEGAVTYGCLYASLEQVRTLTIAKQVADPYLGLGAIPNFSFSSTSTLDGSPWKAPAFNLKPASVGATASVTRELVTGQTVTVTETAPTANYWAFTSLECKDGTGATIGTITGAMATLTNVPEAATAAAIPIACTYVNTYTPKATLTLVKNVTTTGQPGTVATKADWTLTAAGNTAVSGTGDSATIVNKSVIAGTYTFGENATGPAARTAGYEQDGAWVCKKNNTGSALGLGGTTANPTLALAASDNVTCTVTNKYQTGSLAITKTVSGPTAGYTLGTGKTFTAGYSCTLPGSQTVVKSGTVDLNPNTTNGQKGAVATVTEIPAGANCVVTETTIPTGSTDLTDSSWLWGTPTYDAGQTVAITKNATATVDITNPFAQSKGALTITKNVTPRAGVPAAGYSDGTAMTFAIDYSCKIGSTTVKSDTVNLANGASTTITGIPATASCVVSEDAPDAPNAFVDASYRWDGNAFSQPDAITNGGTASATVTNYFTRDLVSLVLKKSVIGAGYTSTAEDFTVNYNCGAPYSGSVTLAKDGSKTVTVPKNVSCTVSEVTPVTAPLAGGYVWGDPSYAGLSNGAVSVTGTTATVTVTNTNTIGFGKISVAKAIGDYASVVGTGTFPVIVSCNAPAQGTTGNYSNTFNLTANAAAIDTPYLPIGTSCTVTESPAPTGSALLPDASYIWGAAPDAQTIAVPASTTPAAATVTNTIQRVYGSLNITKAYNGIDGFTPDSLDFSGTWSCVYGTDAAVTGEWSITGGGTATLTGNSGQILYGSSCTVTEDNLGAPDASDPSYVWATVLPGAVSVNAATPSPTSTVTNSISRIAGSFAVTKTVTGAEAGIGFADGAVFPFSYSCTPAGGGTAITGSLSVPVGGTDGPAAGSIPVGSDCTVTEGDNPTPIDPYRWDSVTLTVTGAASSTAQDERSISFVTPTDESAVSVAAVNAISAKTSDVTVTKTVTGETAGYNGGSAELFPITLTCDASQGTKSAANNDSVTFTGIPLGQDCTATEGNIGTDGLVDGSYAWGTASIGAPVTVSETVATIAVQNPITRVYAPVTLTKTFNNGGFNDVISNSKEYSGGWSCTYGGDAAVTGTWTGTGSAAGTQATMSGVPSAGVLVGSTCGATESDLGAPSNTDPSYRWSTPVITPVTLTANGGNIAVTNTLVRDTGSLTVSKDVTGATAGFTPDDNWAGFPASARCYLSDPNEAGFLSASVVVNDGDEVDLITDVPVGWTCQVAEGTFSGQLKDSSYAWGAPELSIDGAAGNTVMIEDAGASYAVGIDNPISRVKGSFAITKAIAAGTSAGVVNDDANFAGTYSCVYDDGLATEETFDGTWTRTGTGAATLSPAANVPLGTVCSAAETAPNDSGLVDASWTWGDPAVSADVTVTNSQDAPVVTVTNTPVRVWAGLDITKSYTGVDGAFANDTTVAGGWSCSYGTQTVSGRWTLPAAGGTVTAFTPADASVPATALCLVVEDTLSNSVLTDASYTWNAPSYAPTYTTQAGATIGGATLEANETSTITVTNSTARVMGTFGVTKVVSLGSGVSEVALDPNMTFSGEFSCTYPGDVAVTGAWTAMDGQTFTSNPVLVNSVCSVTSEGTRPGPVTGDASFSWTPFTVTDPVTVVAGTVNKVTVTNPVQRLTGSFSITKAVTGDVEGEAFQSKYSFDWQCVAPNGDTFPGDTPGTTDAILAGGIWNAPSTVPAGSTCTIHELALPNPTDPSYAWSTSYGVTGATGTPVDGGLSFVTPAAASQVPVLVTATNKLTRTVGSYTVAKTSNPDSGSTVEPGSDITYTLTVTPGELGFVNSVVVNDDLAEVLNNAELDLASIVASQGTAAPSDNNLVWTVGTVKAGEPLTLSYTVTVNDDAYAVTLRNVITVTGEVPPTKCTPLPGEAPNCDTTEHFTPGWTLSKSSDPASGSVVVPGQVVTYTLEALNTSDAKVSGAVATDDLSAVVDSATLNTSDLDPALSVAPDGKSLTWAVPDLAPGEGATVQYTVTVNEGVFGETIRNVVTPRGEGGECVPAPSPDRNEVAAESEGEVCTTEHRTQKVDLTIDKTHAEIKGNAVDKGDTIAYSLEIGNAGLDAATDVVVTDKLPAGLSYVEGTLVAPEGWTAAFVNGTLTASYEGTLEPGASASITFKALVGQIDRASLDKLAPTLNNSACVVGSEADANAADNCDTDKTPVKPVPPVVVPPKLSSTGVAPELPIGIAAGMLLMGLLLGLITWRRRRDGEDAA